jgi:crossover junction endonuclease MUS81
MLLLIKVDYREKDIIALLQVMKSENNSDLIKIKVDSLKIGDVAFIKTDKDGNEVDNELLLFERKSLNDLASSIKDGRYAEQSFRLDGYQPVPNHNIVYLIEGDLSRYRENKFTCINKKTLLSSMFSILYYKGFSVVRTMNVLETSELIWSWADKLERELVNGKKIPHYRPTSEISSKAVDVEPNSPVVIPENEKIAPIQIELDLYTGCRYTEKKTNENDKNAEQSYDYCNVLKVKKEKNANVTPENIGVIMLSTVPGISSKTAIAIMNEFKTISQLIKSFEQNPHCLNHVCIETGGGKSRKITSTCIENIRKYVLNM